METGLKSLRVNNAWIFLETIAIWNGHLDIHFEETGHCLSPSIVFPIEEFCLCTAKQARCERAHLSLATRKQRVLNMAMPIVGDS